MTTQPGDLPVSRSHLDDLRDRIGIIQFAVGRRPDPSHGYCTDDVARALQVDLRHEADKPGCGAAEAIRHDLAFLEAAFDPEVGRFRKVLGPDGRWTEPVGSEDAHGRAVQALGEVVAAGVDVELRDRARRLFIAALPAIDAFAWARPRAYAILGCAAALQAADAPALVSTTLIDLLVRLERSIDRARAVDPAWPWPEDRCTYDNGVLAEALIVGGAATDRPRTVDLGQELLHWLVEAETAPEGWLRPIGNRGWWPHGGRPAQWDQQPIEPASLVAAACAARNVAGDTPWLAIAERAFAWFLGTNDLGAMIADPARGASRDGLGPDGVNANEGAESTIAWLLAVEHMRAARRDQAESDDPGPGQVLTYASTSAS